MKKSISVIIFTGIFFCLGSFFPTVNYAYTVKKGQTLGGIGKEVKVPWRKIAKDNGIKPPLYTIYVGQELKVSSKQEPQEEVKAVENQAGLHTVKKGQTLGGIGRELSLDWRKIADINKITPPFTIFVGQKLLIPGKQNDAKVAYSLWENPGGNPYHKPAGGMLPLAKAIKGVKSFKDMPEGAKELLITEIKNGNFTFVPMKTGDKYEEMLFEDGILSKIVVGEKWQGARRYTVEFKGEIYILDSPLICHNLCWKKEAPPFKKVEAPPLKKVEAPPLKKVEASLIVEDEAKEDPESFKDCNCNYEFGAYAGNYIGADGLGFNSKSRGEFWGAKGRFFCWKYFSDDGSVVHDFGFYGAYSGGKGRDNDYRGRYWQWDVGPAWKIFGDNWDFGLDLGYGVRRTKGQEDLYSSYQVDEVSAYSAYYNNEENRNAGKKLFPEYGIDFNGLFAINPKQSHNWDGYEIDPNPWDISYVQLMWRQGIWDFYPDNSSTRITPHFNFGGGYEWGDEAPFLQSGPGFKWNWNNQDILTVNLFNFKLKKGSQNDSWLPVFAYWDIYGTSRAIKASKIKVAKVSEYLP